MILLFLDYFEGGGRILIRVSRLTRVTGVCALILISSVFGFAVLRHIGIGLPSYKGFGLESIIIILMYVACLEFVRRSGGEKEKEIFHTEETFVRIWAKFIVLLVVVMALGVWLAHVGEKIVNATTLSQTFIGALFLGFATSFPEMIVTFAAMSAGSVDMAIGNILGSNLFDIFIIPILDFLSKVPLLGVLTQGQMAGTGAAILMSAIAVLGLYIKRNTSKRISWDTVLIFAVGLLAFVILYFIR
jgi:cation:H+ antiporter